MSLETCEDGIDGVCMGVRPGGEFYKLKDATRVTITFLSCELVL